MDAKTWEAIAFQTRDSMAQFVFTFTTPLTASEDRERGWALGTGSYIFAGKKLSLLTNEHVVSDANGAYVAHLPVQGEEYVAATEPFTFCPAPVDVAVTELLRGVPSDDRVLTLDKFDEAYSPVEHELLFWLGYPGTTGTRRDAATEANTRSPGSVILTASAYQSRLSSCRNGPPPFRRHTVRTFTLLFTSPRSARNNRTLSQKRSLIQRG